MKKKEEITEYSPEFYSTGNVQPPKNYRGLITLLLLLVIFLGSLVSVLGFANVRLFHLLQTAEAEASVCLVADINLADSHSSDSTLVAELGFCGSLLTDFDRHYYNLPKGIYVTDVLLGNYGQLLPGDILLTVNGATVTDFKTLADLLDPYSAGASVPLDIYRDGKIYRLSATLADKEK